MERFGEVLLVTAAAGAGGTGLGGLLACFVRRDSRRMTGGLLAFAAGVMTAVVCFDLLADAVLPRSGGAEGRLWLAAAGVLLGYAVTGGLGAAVGRRGQKGLVLAGLVMAAAIALHNVPEGMVIGASFARDRAAPHLGGGGLVMAAVIGLHNVPEGMAVAAPLVSGGGGRLRAVLITVAAGLPTVLGAAAGYSLGTMGPVMLSAALSFASGAMLCVVFGELLPEAFRLWPSHMTALAAVAGIIAGMVIVYA